MNVVAPIAFRLDARQNADGTFDVKYEEDVGDEHLAIFDDSIRATQAVCTGSNITAERVGKRTLRLATKNASLNQLGAMMMGEFMQWTTFGQMKIADLMASAAMAGRHAQVFQQQTARLGPTEKSPAELMTEICDRCGAPALPDYAVRDGKRYCSYVCRDAAQRA